MTHIRLVTFDITNTVLRLRYRSGQAYGKVAALYGVDADVDRLTQSYLQLYKQYSIQYPNFGAESCGWRSWWSKLVRDTFIGAGYNVNENKLSSITQHLFKMYSGPAAWEMQPFAAEAVHGVRGLAHGLTIGVISNFDERLDSLLVEMQVRSFFDFVLNSYIIRLSKPDPAVFEAALEQCKEYTMGFEAVHIGDDIEKDYRAAKNAGWNAILFGPQLPQEELEEKNIDLSCVVRSLRDIPQCIQNLKMKM